ncbi:MAG: hypothetical protein H6622_03295 [Halobacteriovoraceae bacterium]|nr:hypothetical protein [Halobacteriovoraceae bacterium]
MNFSVFKFCIYFITVSCLGSSLISKGLYEGHNPKDNSKCRFNVLKIAHKNRSASPLHRIIFLSFDNIIFNFQHSMNFDFDETQISNFIFDNKKMIDIIQIGYRLYPAKLYLDPLKNYQEIQKFEYLNPVSGIHVCEFPTKISSEILD